MAKAAEPNRREDILWAARQVFKELGYENARVEEIARRAGVAKGTVYLYFKSKLAILEALVDYYYEIMEEAAFPAIANPDSAQAIRESIHAAFETASRERDLVVLLDLRLGFSNSRKQETIGNPRALKKTQAFLKNCQRKGELRNYDPAVAAVLMGGLLQWIVKLCLVWQGDNLVKYEDTAVRMIQFALLNNFTEDDSKNKRKANREERA
jgi:AcrR family transcriptional regulator